MQDNIREAVNIGSVYLALENKFFTHQELLEWLLLAPFDFRTLLAYRAICQVLHPNEQYMSDDSHFLTKNPKYIHIALILGCDKNLPSKKGGTISIYLLLTLDNTKLDETFKYNMLTIVNPSRIEFITNEVIFRAYLGRNFLHSAELSTKECNNLLVQADWTFKFRYTEDLAKDIIIRMNELSLLAPNYYNLVALPTYRIVATKLNKEKLLTKLSQEELVCFDKYFPNIVDERLLNYSNIPYKIALMSNDVAGYILGFPIHMIIPNEQQIYKALTLIEKTSIEHYIATIKNYNKSLPKNLPFIDTFQELSNEQDVLMDNVVDYLPFDIVTYQTGDHVFRFTRPEFSQILESKKNPWTKEWLPETILGEIKARQEAVKKLGLPPARVIEDVFVRVGNNTFFEGENLEKKNDTFGTRISQMEAVALQRIIDGDLEDVINALGRLGFGTATIIRGPSGNPQHGDDDLPELEETR